MTDILEKCDNCAALLDEEDLFCANCGKAAAQALVPANAAASAGVATHNFRCEGCGASMSYDASASALRCPFCGGADLTATHDAKTLSARFIVPFRIDRTAATTILRGWLGRGFWRPGDLATGAVVSHIVPVFVPYWVFRASTYTYWTADSSVTPPYARASWHPVSGEHRSEYAGVLVGASGALTQHETAALCPFDLSQGAPPDEVDLNNVTVEQFAVQRKYARPLARLGLEQLEAEACKVYVRGSCRNMKVNVRVEGLSSEPMLLPVWIMAYQYRGKLFRFLINGQSGKATGEAPVSTAKIAAAIAIGAVAAVMGLVTIAACAGLVGR